MTKATCDKTGPNNYPLAARTRCSGFTEQLGRCYLARNRVLSRFIRFRSFRRQPQPGMSLVKCGSTEIDGYAFCAGLDALKPLYDDDPSFS